MEIKTLRLYKEERESGTNLAKLSLEKRYIIKFVCMCVNLTRFKYLKNKIFSSTYKP